MAEHEFGVPKPKPPIDESLVINTRLNQIEKEERKYKRRQVRTNNLMVLFTGLLFVTSVASDSILVWQTSVTRRSADAAERSSKLTENLTKNENAAWFSVDVVPQGMFSADDVALGGVRIRFRNMGKAFANRLNGTAKVTFESFPGGTVIRSQPMSIPESQVRANDTKILYFKKVFTATDIPMLESDAATMRATADFSYEDGFGDRVHSSICKLYFVRHIPETGVVNERAWGDCDVVSELILSHEIKNHRRSDKNKQ